MTREKKTLIIGMQDNKGKHLFFFFLFLIDFFAFFHQHADAIGLC